MELLATSPAKRRIDPTPVYESYWRFAAERQSVFYKRLAQPAPPWTADRVLSEYRFTNTYRAADRVSQYLIRNVIYQGDQTLVDLFFRIFVFRTFNRISTWEILKSSFGDVRYSDYTFSRYARVLSDVKRSGKKIYSAAYIMPSAREAFGNTEKHRNHLRLIELMMKERVPERVCEAKTMRKGFEILMSFPSIGPFLAYQYITDINYSTAVDFSEMEFVVAGPGARSGIRKCFANAANFSEEYLVRYVAERQSDEFEKRGIEFQDLWGRPLQLIDCQNLFCEVDKYARAVHPEYRGYGGRRRIKQQYKFNPDPVEFWFPPKWGINVRLKYDEDLPLVPHCKLASV